MTESLILYIEKSKKKFSKFLFVKNMSIPKFDETLIPILEILADGLPTRRADLGLKLLEVKKFSLTPEEEKVETASGVNLYSNRVAWGSAYLKQGKFVMSPERGNIQITEKGKALLQSGKGLTLSELRHDPDFVAHQKKISIERDSDKALESGSVTPQDMIDLGFQSITETVKQELHEKLFAVNPYFFEKIVLQLFQKMGYGDFLETPKSGDGGIDGIINQDQLGVEKIYIQAKRYGEGNKVREPLIRNFIGAMAGDTNKGIFVTTSEFDESAIKKAREAMHKIILIDGKKLVDLMIRYNVGIQIKTTYDIKQVDEDFFDEN
jgi:restriction system protein